MTTLAPRSKHSILMQYKSQNEKRERIDELIDIILNDKLPPDELEEAKEEAVTLAESLLRCDTKKRKETPNAL